MVHVVRQQIRGFAVRQVKASIGEDDDEDEVELDPVTGEPIDYGGGSWDVIWDLQATHRTRIAQQHYAVYSGSPGQLTAHMVVTYREISRL